MDGGKSPKHPVKPGRVTISGYPGDDVPSGLEKSIRQQAQLNKQEEPKKIEKKGENPKKEKQN